MEAVELGRRCHAINSFVAGISPASRFCNAVGVRLAPPCAAQLTAQRSSHSSGQASCGLSSTRAHCLGRRLGRTGVRSASAHAKASECVQSGAGAVAECVLDCIPPRCSWRSGVAQPRRDLCPVSSSAHTHGLSPTPVGIVVDPWKKLRCARPSVLVRACSVAEGWGSVHRLSESRFSYAPSANFRAVRRKLWQSSISQVAKKAA